MTYRGSPLSLISVLTFTCLARGAVLAETVNLQPVRDNTLYEDPAGSLSKSLPGVKLSPDPGFGKRSRVSEDNRWILTANPSGPRRVRSP